MVYLEEFDSIKNEAQFYGINSLFYDHLNHNSQWQVYRVLRRGKNTEIHHHSAEWVIDAVVRAGSSQITVQV